MDWVVIEVFMVEFLCRVECFGGKGGNSSFGGYNLERSRLRLMGLGLYRFCTEEFGKRGF